MSAGSPNRTPTSRAEVAAHWVARESLGSLTERDRESLAAWLGADPANHAAYFAAKSAMVWLSGAETETAFRNAHASRTPRTGTAPAAMRIPGPRARRPAALAAWAAGIATLGLFLFFFKADLQAMQADYASTPGELKHVRLPDGTEILLDTRTAIDIRFTDTEREVSLIRGRAYFNVAHERVRPFTVRTLGGEARDIGTAFIVSQRDGRAETLVTEGKVEVASANRRVSLEAGQGTRWREGDSPAPATTFNEHDESGWRTGSIIVKRRTFADVVDEVNRYRRWPILLLDRDVARRVVTGVVQTDNLDAGITALAEAQGLRTLSLPFTTILF